MARNRLNWNAQFRKALISKAKADFFEKFKKYPFGNTELMATIGQSAQRSRQFFMILLFSGAFIFMSLANALKQEFNWFKLKLHKYELMDQYLSFDDSQGFNDLRTFIETTESTYKTDTRFSKDEIVNILRHIGPSNLKGVNFRIKYPRHNLISSTVIDKSIRRKTYEEIGEAISYANMVNVYSDDQIDDTRRFLTETRIKNIDLLNIPVLGITFNNNYLGLYSSIILFILFTMLSYSILSEYNNIKIALDYNVKDTSTHHYFFYSLLSMQQVLFKPKQLFRNENKWSGGTNNITRKALHLGMWVISLLVITSCALAFFDVIDILRIGNALIIFLFVFFALCLFFLQRSISKRSVSQNNLYAIGMYGVILVYISVMVYDLYTLNIAMAFSYKFTLVIIPLYLLFVVSVLNAFNLAMRNNRKAGQLWQNLAIEYNLEFVLESINEREKTELLSYGRQIFGRYKDLKKDAIESADRNLETDVSTIDARTMLGIIERDKRIVQEFWNETVENIKKDKITILEYARSFFIGEERIKLGKMVDHVEKFIDNCFSIDNIIEKDKQITLSNNATESISKKRLELLENWFKMADVNKMHRSFARTLYSDVIAKS